MQAAIDLRVHTAGVLHQEINPHMCTTVCSSRAGRQARHHPGERACSWKSGSSTLHIAVPLLQCLEVSLASLIKLCSCWIYRRTMRRSVSLLQCFQLYHRRPRHARPCWDLTPAYAAETQTLERVLWRGQAPGASDSAFRTPCTFAQRLKPRKACPRAFMSLPSGLPIPQALHHSVHNSAHNSVAYNQWPTTLPIMVKTW
jgi:hypothetical protein